MLLRLQISSALRRTCLGMACALVFVGLDVRAATSQDALAFARPALRTVRLTPATSPKHAGHAVRADTSALTLSFRTATYRLVGDRVFVLPRLNERDVSTLMHVRPRVSRLEMIAHEPDGAAIIAMPSREAFAPAAGLHMETADVPRYLLLHHLSGLAESAQTMEAMYAEMGTAGLHRITGARDAELLARTSRQMATQARYATEIAQTLPLLETQGYLTEVRARDETLFENLLTEQALEERVETVAASLAELAEGPARAAQESELRALLSHLFDLKQENRRAEAEQLRERLDQLNQRLDDRDRLKDRIIDRRLRRLTTKD